ncbi:MAG: hypothetical protein RIC15_09875 [Vicingaceae bacterium]
MNLQTSGQRRISISSSPVAMYYQGDLSGSIFPSLKTTHPGMEIAFGFRLNEAFKFRLGYLRGRVSGRDSLVSSLAVRNLHFRSPISDIRLMANVDVVELFRKIWPGKLMNSREYRRNLIGPDLIMGLGMVKMNPKGNYQGDWVALQALGTEGQFIEGEDNPTPYKLWQFNLISLMGDLK